MNEIIFCLWYMYPDYPASSTCFEANNNKYVCRQIQVLIIGVGYWVQVFNLIRDSSVSLSAGIQSAGDSVPETLGSNPEFSRRMQVVFFRFKNRLPVP